MLLICPGCGHTKHFAKLAIAGKRFRCTNCDARAANALRNFHLDGDINERERELARIETFSGLLWICREKGHKPGWVSHKFRALYLIWPDYRASRKCLIVSCCIGWPSSGRSTPISCAARRNRSPLSQPQA